MMLCGTEDKVLDGGLGSCASGQVLSPTGCVTLSEACHSLSLFPHL